MMSSEVILLFDKYKNTIAPGKSITRYSLLLMANESSLSVEHFCLKLEELGLIKTGSWEWFLENGGVTPHDRMKVICEAKPATKMSQFVRRIIVSRSNLKPWSWDACEKRVKDLIAADDLIAATEFWKKLAATINPKATREEQAIAEESFARIEEMWNRHGGQAWHDSKMVVSYAFEESIEEQYAFS